MLNINIDINTPYTLWICCACFALLVYSYLILTIYGPFSVEAEGKLSIIMSKPSNEKSCTFTMLLLYYC